MTRLLSGKVALVTGVSRQGQVGQTVAKALAAEGAALAIVARSRDHIEARAAELRVGGARVLPVAANLADESEVQRMVDRLISEYSRIDVLVNLAGGLTRYKPAVEHTLEDWNYEVGNNLLAAFLCARAVFTRQRDAGGGTIINFARAGLAQANMVAYNCAKAGVEALTRTLLFVDDSPFFRNMLVPVLKAAGYDVTAAPGGEEALAVIKKGQKFDVIVSDIEMPGMNGFELAEAIRADARAANTPIIALSSLTSPASIERGRQAGFHDFVAKFDRQGLIAALKETSAEWAEAA